MPNLVVLRPTGLAPRLITSLVGLASADGCALLSQMSIIIGFTLGVAHGRQTDATGRRSWSRLARVDLGDGYVNVLSTLSRVR